MDKNTETAYNNAPNIQPLQAAANGLLIFGKQHHERTEQPTNRAAA
ncbi:hypothetical protein [Neisseria animaloris]|nr:hypothetical protein [Neisseria animaloris]